MRKYLMGFLMLVPFLALAQVVDAPPTGDDWQKFVESIGGLKGAGALGIAALLVRSSEALLELEGPLSVWTHSLRPR